jgi:methyl-accepting chemotaxis protein
LKPITLKKPPKDKQKGDFSMKKWSLNAKVTFVISILAMGAMAISYTAIKSMSGLNESLKSIVDVDVRRDQLTSLITDSQRLAGMNLRDFIIERNPVKMQKYKESFQQNKSDLYKYLAEYRSIASDDGKAIADQYKNIAEKWVDSNEKVFQLAAENKDAEVAEYREKVTLPLISEMRSYIQKMNELTAKRLKEAVTDGQATYENSRLMMIVISLVSIFASLALAFVILRAVTKAIDQVIANLTDSSNQVTSAAQQIASSSEELSQAATEQASSLEETASSIEEMNSMVHKNAENAKRTSELSNNSHDTAEKGKAVVQDMIKAIDDISESNNTIMNQIDDSNQKISEIVKVIAEIGNKTKVINDIVFQTKLLSFNASVEAARAGEHGKGFAVVAEEVGNLAQMSGNAAKEISSMLDGSIRKVEGIVNETKQKVGNLVLEGKSKVELGTTIAKHCGEVLNEIVENVSNVTQMANEISTACQEQAQGVQEITKAMNQLDQVTQTNAATSEEAASAAEELSSQAESLRTTVGVLIQEIKGAHGDQETSASLVSAPRPRVEKSNVVSFQQRKPKTQVKPQKLKKASGYDSSIPSEDDPRFEEV